MTLQPNKSVVLAIGFALGLVYVGTIVIHGAQQFEAGQRSIADDAATAGAFRVKGRAFQCERLNGSEEQNYIARDETEET